MAYNPFNIFRRNQKAIFAVLTVFIMFMFTLSSGLGGGADFFEWLPAWLGAKSRKGEVLCTIDGTKVYSGELEKLRRNRIVANRFMELAAMQARENVRRFVEDTMPRATPERVRMFREIQNLQQMGYIPFQAQFAIQMGQISPAQLVEIREGTLQQVQARLGQISSEEKASSGDRDIARALLLTVLLDRQQDPTSQGIYFTNARNRGTRDTIEFLLWQKKADQLGIRFTEADVWNLIRREFLGQFRDDVSVRNELARSIQGFSLTTCLKAIGEEFRVRAAQAAVGGYMFVPERGDRTLTGAPIFTPPYDLFAFYRTECSTTTYEVLSVPAEAFVSAVPTPDPEKDPAFRRELEDLYNKHKDQEPNPANESPGFKEPRKVKVGWVEATGSEPYYQKASADRLAKTLAAAGLVPPGPSPWTAVVSAAVATADPLVQSVYESEWAGRHRDNLSHRWSSHHLGGLWAALDTSVVRPANVAALVGGLGGGLAAFAPPGAAAAPLLTGTMAFEVRDRVQAGMALFLGATPGPGLFGTAMAGEARYRLSQPKPLPLAAVRAEVLRLLSEREARKAVVADMTKLRTDVVKIFQEAKEKPDAKAAKARALVEEFVKTRGLKSGESGLRTEWTIEEDPGLAPLKDAWAKAVPAHGRMRVPFGGTFFWERDRPGSRRPATGVYRPEFYPDAQPRPELAMFRDPEPVFLTWRTEEKAARPVPFNEARPEVIAAWKRLRAREIAKTRAETIAAQIQKRGTTSEYTIRQDLNDQAGVLRGQTAEPKAQEKIRRFALPDVAPLAPPDRNDLTGAADREALRPFGLTASPDIPYPTREMVKALLDERTKPLNTALVLPDAPHDTYYVAVVAQRLEKNDADFSRSVYSETGVSGARAAVRMAYAEDARRKTTESVLALLRQEFKYAETDDQKKKIDKGDREGD